MSSASTKDPNDTLKSRCELLGRILKLIDMGNYSDSGSLLEVNSDNISTQIYSKDPHIRKLSALYIALLIKWVQQSPKQSFIELERTSLFTSFKLEGPFLIQDSLLYITYSEYISNQLHYDTLTSIRKLHSTHSDNLIYSYALERSNTTKSLIIGMTNDRLCEILANPRLINCLPDPETNLIAFNIRLGNRNIADYINIVYKSRDSIPPLKFSRQYSTGEEFYSLDLENLDKSNMGNSTADMKQRDNPLKILFAETKRSISQVKTNKQRDSRFSATPKRISESFKYNPMLYKKAAEDLTYSLSPVKWTNESFIKEQEARPEDNVPISRVSETQAVKRPEITRFLAPIRISTYATSTKVDSELRTKSRSTSKSHLSFTKLSSSEQSPTRISANIQHAKKVIVKQMYPSNENSPYWIHSKSPERRKVTSEIIIPHKQLKTGLSLPLDSTNKTYTENYTTGPVSNNTLVPDELHDNELSPSRSPTLINNNDKGFFQIKRRIR